MTRVLIIRGLNFRSWTAKNANMVLHFIKVHSEMPSACVMDGSLHSFQLNVFVTRSSVLTMPSVVRMEVSPL